MLKPLGHRVLVEVDEIAEKQGSLYLTEETRRRMGDAQIFGTVIDFGSTAWEDFGGKPWCEVGDYVAFAKYGGFIIQDPETKKKYRLLNDEDICVKMTKGG